MQRITVSGPGPVASLLRTVADGIDSGSIRLGDEIFDCASTISAVVEAPGQEPAEVVTVLLHFAPSAGRRYPLEVEQELTHPGG